MKPNGSFFLTVAQLHEYFSNMEINSNRIYVTKELRKEFLTSVYQGRVKIDNRWVHLDFEDVGGDVWRVGIPTNKRVSIDETDTV